MIIKENNWLDTIKILLDNINKTYKKNKDFIFNETLIIINPEILKNPFESCCYFNYKTKIKQLEKHYYNPKNWENLKYKGIESIEIQTEKKQPCFYKILINHELKEIEVYFRKSDFIKKFRIDLYFILEILKKHNMENYTIKKCILETTLLRTFYILILFENFKEEDLLYYSKNNIFFKDALKMLEEENIKNLKGISKYKMLRRWVKYTVESLPYKKIKELEYEYIRN